MFPDYLSVSYDYGSANNKDICTKVEFSLKLLLILSLDKFILLTPKGKPDPCLE